MPFLRFNKDRRGYETTAVLHAFREHGRAQPRILYWFRSPIATKVGRSAIDEDAIRALEERHPDLSFDWAKILESRAVIAAETPRAARRKAEGVRRNPSTAYRSPPREQAVAGTEVVAGGMPAAQPEAAAGEKPAKQRRSRRRGRVPSLVAAVMSDAETPAARATEAAAARHATAAEEMFSPEDLTRLRGRHAAVLARIDRAVSDPSAARALHEEAEALNPDSWLTHEDVARALEEYERTYRKLLDALGPRQRASE